MSLSMTIKIHDTQNKQYSEELKKDTQHNGTQNIDTQRKDIKTPNITKNIPSLNNTQHDATQHNIKRIHSA
jgi:hypothetical protein